MKLQSLEKKLSIKFPLKMWEIYQTGSMKWLELGEKTFLKKKESIISNPNSFMMINCECEFILFSEISATKRELKSWIKEREEDEEIKFKRDVILVPFGKNGAGDLYCFLYMKSEKNGEPKIILYSHDDYDDPDIISETFDEFLYILMLSAAAFGEDVHGECWKTHVAFLSDEYQNKVANKTVDELTREYDSLEYQQADVWDVAEEDDAYDSTILSWDNRAYRLKFTFFEADDYYDMDYKDRKYRVIGIYENESQVVCLAENGNVFIIPDYEDRIIFVANDFETLEHEINAFEKMVKEADIIDEVSATEDEDKKEEILKEISSNVKNIILECDSTAFSSSDTLWSQICRHIEHGIVFM